MRQILFRDLHLVAVSPAELAIIAIAEQLTEEENGEDQAEVLVRLHLELLRTDLAVGELKGSPDAPPVEPR